jgi:hypothetical protein
MGGSSGLPSGQDGPVDPTGAIARAEIAHAP